MFYDQARLSQYLEKNIENDQTDPVRPCIMTYNNICIEDFNFKRR